MMTKRLHNMIYNEAFDKLILFWYLGLSARDEILNYLAFLWLICSGAISTMHFLILVIRKFIFAARVENAMVVF